MLVIISKIQRIWVGSHLVILKFHQKHSFLPNSLFYDWPIAFWQFTSSILLSSQPMPFVIFLWCKCVFSLSLFFSMRILSLIWAAVFPNKWAHPMKKAIFPLPFVWIYPRFRRVDQTSLTTWVKFFVNFSSVLGFISEIDNHSIAIKIWDYDIFNLDLRIGKL